MKNLFVICLLSIISSVFGQVKSPCGNIRKKSEPRRCLNCYDQVSYDEEINTYVLTKDGFTPFNGTCQTWNRSGYVLEELTCTNGKRDGIDTSFYGSGCVQSTQGYILGIKNGKHQVFFDSTGQLRKEENYLNGKLHGLVQEYNRSGDTLLYMNYALDIPHGIQRTYYPDGKRFKVISYKNGLLDGSHLTYTAEGKLELKLSYKEGKILKQGTYKKNIAIGEHNVFDSKGKLIHQTTYDKKGVKTYEMEVDEYGDQKVLYAASGPAKPAGIEEDDDPKNIEPVNEKKNKRKKRKERRKKE